MASIRKRGEYQFQCRISRKGYPPQSQTFESKAEAEKWARDIESSMDKCIFVSRAEADSTTLAEALDRYLKEVTSRKKGWKAETNRIKSWQKHKLASRYLGSLRSSDFALYRDNLRTSGLSENTIRLSLAIISHLFNTAIKEWGIEGLKNPIELIRMPKGSKARDRRIMSSEVPNLTTGVLEVKSEIDLIVEASNDKELSAVIYLAIETAMRRSEIAGLKWDLINFKNRTLHLSDTKPNEARDVPLSSKAIKTLESIPRRHIQASNGKLILDQNVFSVFSLDADKISQAFGRARLRARKIYEKSCIKYGLEPNVNFIKTLRLHDHHHESTSRLFESGRFDTMEVAAITGHKTLQMLKRYTHLKAENLAKKLD